MSSWTLFKLNGEPVVAKSGGSEKGKDSEDPIQDIRHAKVVWLNGRQVKRLRERGVSMQNGTEHILELPTLDKRYKVKVNDYVGDSKMLDIVMPTNFRGERNTFGLTSRQAKEVAFPSPHIIRRWHKEEIDPGKTEWTIYAGKDYGQPGDTIYPVNLK